MAEGSVDAGEVGNAPRLDGERKEEELLVCIETDDAEVKAMEEPDVEIVDTRSVGVGLLSSSSSSPPLSLPLLTLLKSKENEPASRCCTMCTDGSVEFGEVTPNAQIRDWTVPPVLGMSKASIGLMFEY